MKPVPTGLMSHLEQLNRDRSYKEQLRPHLERSKSYLEVANDMTKSPEGRRFGRLATAIADALHYTEAAIDALSDFPDE